MIHVTCRLNSKNRDQLRNHTLGNRVWATFFHRLQWFIHLGAYGLDREYGPYHVRSEADWTTAQSAARLRDVNALKTHTPFNGPFSGTTQVTRRYQKGKTNLDFNETRDSEWQWHQLGHMQVCTSLQTDNHAGTPPLKFLTFRMLFLPPSQQRQSTEGSYWNNKNCKN